MDKNTTIALEPLGNFMVAHINFSGVALLDPCAHVCR